MNVVPGVRPGLLRHKLDGQVLVYDTKGDKVHLLDPTTACVLDLLEEGGRTADAIVDEMSRRIAVAKEQGLYTLSVEELRKADLLDDKVAHVPALPDVTRRDLLRKMAFTGAAALLIPAISTLAATPAYAQGSCMDVGSPCQSNNNCCSNRCGTPAQGPDKTCQP